MADQTEVVDKSDQINIYIPYKRRYPFNHSFFEDGDIMCFSSTKHATFDADSEEFLHKLLPEFSCHIAGCMITFTNIRDYEIHYNSLHRHVCSSCKKTFPTHHLLDVHFVESHDALFKIQAERQNMYQCLVEGCEEKFMNSKERQAHLMKIHHYPHEYRFFNLKREKSRQPSRRNEEDSNMEDVHYSGENTSSGGVSIKYAPKVPKNICFGQGVSRGFMPRNHGSKTVKHKGKHWHQACKPENMDTTVDIENVKFQEICHSLPSVE